MKTGQQYHDEEINYNTQQCYIAPIKNIKEYFKGKHIDEVQPLEIDIFLKKLYNDYRWSKQTIKLDDFNYLPVLIAVSLGLRRGEVLGLKWSDFDLNKKTVHIQRTATPVNGGYDFSPCKTQDSNRVLLLPDFLIASLNDWKSEQDLCYVLNDSFNPDGFVFCLPNNRIISATGLNKRFKKLLKECGLPDVRFHDLRHSWATMMLSQNIPTKIASSFLGHSNVTTTLNIYTHMLTDMQKPAIDVLNSVFTVTN